MPREIEVKLRVGDPEAVRDRLRSLGAARQRSEFELNRVFDTPDSRLRTAGCGLRVRVARRLDPDGSSTATLTFKGPRDPGPIRSREELETNVGDAETLVAILAGLGFALRVVYEKRRETWTMGDAEITLDELPRLGWFAEIEASAAAAVEHLRRELGFSDDATVHESYVELAATHGIDRDATRCLLFDG